MLLFSISLLILKPNLVQTKTALQKSCEEHANSGANAVYLWNSCVTMPTIALTWDQAAIGCNEFQNGHLVTLPLKQMLTQLQDVLANSWSVTVGYLLWIGLRQPNSTNEPAGNFEWHLNGGRKVNTLVDIWAGSEPNHAIEGENCVYYHHDNGLYDAICNVGHWAICQYDDAQPAAKVFRKHFKGKSGHPSGRVSEYVGLSHRIDCARKCGDDIICHSFSWNQNGSCLLNSDDGTHPSYLPQTDNGYDMFVWQL